MKFHEWWSQQVGHPPQNKNEQEAFAMSMLAWQAALMMGDVPPVEPAKIERSLMRVGSGETTHEDELLLRHRIQIGDDTLAMLESQVESYAAVAQEVADAAPPQKPGPVPDGAIAMGGKVWKCPRCNFINGIKSTRPECRACNFPGAETREWILKPEVPCFCRDCDWKGPLPKDESWACPNCKSKSISLNEGDPETGEDGRPVAEAKFSEAES